MARVEDASSEEDDEPEVIIEDDATELEEVDNESEASDDMSEGDGEEAERALEQRVRELEEKIQKDPYVYDDHIELIASLEKLSELERMRDAFERLHSVSPLAAEHWLLRLQTEAALAHTPVERRAVQRLFQRATTELYWIPVYVNWCTFALGGDEEETRSTFRTVLRRTGADPFYGRLLWETLKEHEKEQLSRLSEESEGYGEQVVRVARCLAEQLTRPLLPVDAATTAAAELRELLAAHGAHLREDYLDQIMKQHEQVKVVRDQLSEFEDRLLTVKNVDEKCTVYTEYIERVRQLQEEQDGEIPFSYDEIRMVLYERATYECAASELPAADALCSAWCRLARALGTEEYARAVDACVSRRPRCAQYWLLLMQRLERDGDHFDEIKSTLERALAHSLPQPEYLALWCGYLECLRRCTDLTSAERCETLRQNMRLACTAIQEVPLLVQLISHKLWGDEGDPGCSVLMYWARLEYRRMGDHAQGKELFEEIFQSEYNKSLSRFWLALLELEASRAPRPPDKKLRDLHRRALKFTGDYPPAVAERWEQFEQDYGTADTLHECRDACREKLKLWRQNLDSQKEKKNNQKGAKNKSKPQGKKSKGKDPKAAGSKQTESGGREGGEGKGKKRAAAGDGGGGDDVKRKRVEGGSETAARQNGAVKRSHGSEDSADRTVSPAAESKRQRVSTEAEAAARLNGDARPPPGSAETEARTLFVSNLDFKFDEAALRETLGAWGTVVSLRTVRGVKAFGGSICYCEYSTPEAVAEATKHDRTPLAGRPMFLSRYRGERERPRFRYATAPERNKLFVKNLPFTHCTDARLREVFAPHGALRDIRIVTYKDGRPKGLAYVEYEDDKSATTALQRTDGLLLGDRNLQVALSAPPPRADGTAAAPPPASSLGQGRRDAAGGARKSQLSSFVPRVLRTPVAAAAAAPTTSTAAATAGPSKQLSNTDFRNMLLNNK